MSRSTKNPELPLFPLGKMIEDAEVADPRFKDKSMAIYQITINDAPSKISNPEKRALAVRTYLNSLPPTCPIFEVRKGNWLVGMKNDELWPVFRGNEEDWKKKSEKSRIRDAGREQCLEGDGIGVDVEGGLAGKAYTEEED